MATELEFVQYVCEQAEGVAGLSWRKMFGEYAIYAGGKVVALACDNQLFLKATAAGRALLASPVEAPPYPGARPHLLLNEQLEDRELLGRLFRATERELPLPKAKRRRASRR